jgi:hypothetical protein
MQVSLEDMRQKAEWLGLEQAMVFLLRLVMPEGLCGVFFGCVLVGVKMLYIFRSVYNQSMKKGFIKFDCRHCV